MTTTVARGRVVIEGDTGDLVKALRGGERATEETAQRIGRSFAISQFAVNAFADAVRGGIAALPGIFNQTRNEVDELAKSAARLGIGTKELAGLELAAEFSGVSINNLRVGIQRATRRISDAAAIARRSASSIAAVGAATEGTTKAVAEASNGTTKALQELGLNAQELNQLSPDQQLERIADAFQNVENSADQVRLAFALFDSEGVGLLNTLRGGSEGLRAVREEAEKLGIALSEVDTARIERVNDQLKRIERITTGLERQFTAAFSPLVEALATIFIDSTSDIASWRRFFDSAVGVAADVVQFLIRSWFDLDAAVNFVTASFARAVEESLSLIQTGAAAFELLLGGLGIDIIGSFTEAIGGVRKEVALFAEASEQSVRSAQETGRRLANSFRDSFETALADRGPISVTGSGTNADAAALAEQQRLEDLRQAEQEKRDKAELERRQQLSDRQLETLQNALATEEELLRQQLQKRIEIIDEGLELRRINELQAFVFRLEAQEDFNAQLLRLEEEQQARIDKLAEDGLKDDKERCRKRVSEEKKKRDQILRIAQGQANALGSIGDSIVALAGEQDSKALAVAKAFSVAQIAVNTAVGISRAFAEFGFPGGILPAAAIAASGVAGIAKVVSASPGNGSVQSVGGGSGGVGGSLGSGDVCAAVDRVNECSGAAGGDSDGRLGTDGVVAVNVVQFGEANLDALVSEIAQRVNENDVVIFNGESAQAQEIRR